MKVEKSQRQGGRKKKKIEKKRKEIRDNLALCVCFTFGFLCENKETEILPFLWLNEHRDRRNKEFFFLEISEWFLEVLDVF